MEGLDWEECCLMPGCEGLHMAYCNHWKKSVASPIAWVRSLAALSILDHVGGWSNCI